MGPDHINYGLQICYVGSSLNEVQSPNTHWDCIQLINIYQNCFGKRSSKINRNFMFFGYIKIVISWHNITDNPLIGNLYSFTKCDSESDLKEIRWSEESDEWELSSFYAIWEGRNRVLKSNPKARDLARNGLSLVKAPLCPFLPFVLPSDVKIVIQQIQRSIKVPIKLSSSSFS